ncbi:diguanylate cyclase [Halomonas sp. HP20-15]|uniref:diguanylate cyclase n=1 Tax=Halomonas sp. HP20-15 TaxID=3085901 RepID=UPI002980FDE0|nr:diguanylate cyclase [Halomonas sp. HP20-15]MDW5377847.1 diguanylate cyclase [Halomonas sp. HP20-15]
MPWRLLAGIVALFAGLLSGPDDARAHAGPVREPESLKRVSLQLLWHHQFQFAGYYAAVDQGYYRDAGLEVEIRSGGYDAQGHAPDPVEEVVFGRADFGTSRADLLIHHSHGLPVALLASIMQRSPLIFLTLKRYGFNRLEAIGDRPVSLTLPSLGSGTRVSAETLAALERAGVDYRALDNSAPSWQLADLLDGTTQLIPAYVTDTPYFVRQAGARPVEIKPTDYGIDFYGQLLFTSQQLLDEAPETAAAFRRASLQGWRYALDHPQEIAELILRDYGTRGPGYDKAFLLAEAERIRGLMQPELIEIGYTNRQRWQQIADTYSELGLIGHYELDRFLQAALPPRPQLANLWAWSLPGLSVLLGIAGIAGYLYATNRRLVTEVGRRQHAEQALRHHAERDGLTGALNRRLFDENYQHEIARAHAGGRALSLIIFDVDHFKLINDHFGHLAGDQVLIDIAAVTRPLLRATDYFGRYGGEEFALLLPDTPLDEACEIAQRLNEAHRAHRVVDGASTIHYTVSLGVAALRPDDGSSDALLRRADQLLYQAKRAGRDTLMSQGVDGSATPVG